MRFPSVLDGYGLDLDLGALGQVLDGEGGAGRALAVKEGGVDLVHGAEVRDVREQHGGLDDVLEAETGLGEDGADVLEALLGLALDILGGEGAGGGVDGQLAGDEGEPAGGGDALGVGCLLYTSPSPRDS